MLRTAKIVALINFHYAEEQEKKSVPGVESYQNIDIFEFNVLYFCM